MRTIIASKEFMEAVTSGIKKQTIRFWKRPTKIQPGEIVNLFNYRETLPVRVTHIYEKPAHELTLDEAQANGHATLESFRMAIIRCYKSLDFKALVIRFEPAL